MTPSPTRILGIGNSILGDDAVGLHAARRLRDLVPPGVSVLEAECGGIALVEFLAGCRRAFVLDAMVCRDAEPGTVVRAGLGELWASPRLGSAHDVTLDTVVRLGQEYGFQMPEELVVYGIQIHPARVFSEALTPAAEVGVQRAVTRVLTELRTGSS